MDYLRIRSAVNANLQNQINTSIILHYIRQKGASYRSEISKALGLSLPAVSRAVQHLINKNILEETRVITDTGKKAHEVVINASFGIFIGICIELPLVKFSSMDMDGNIIHIVRTTITADTKNLNDFILVKLQAFLEDSLPSREKAAPVLAIGLSLPVAVDPQTEKIYAVLYQGLEVQSLQTQIADTVDAPVMMENNENLAAHAEKYYKNGIPEATFAFVTVHQGIGAGLMIDGRILQGANGAAGEIGYQHLTVDPHRHAILPQTYENLASIDKIRTFSMELIHSGRGEEIFKAANYTSMAIDHVLVSQLAKAGSEDAAEVFDRYAKVLAIGLANFLLAINPHTVILGGALCELEDPQRNIVKPLHKELSQLLPFPAPHIRMTRLGRDAAVTGAAQFALEHTVYNDYPYIPHDTAMVTQ